MATFNASDVAAMQNLGGAVANLSNTISASDTSRKDREFMEHMYDRQVNDWYSMQQYLNNVQKLLTDDARSYSEKLTAKEWELYNSPSAQIRAMRAAGINPNAILSKGSSPVSPVQSEAVSSVAPSSGTPPGSSPGYSPRYYQDPLYFAQAADLAASAELKRSQADFVEHESAYKDAATALTQQETILKQLSAEGVQAASKMQAINLRIAQALEDTNIDIGREQLSKIREELNLVGRQVRSYDDQHDLHDLKMSELENQLAIQFGSFALLCVRARAAEKGIELTDAQIRLVEEEINKVQADADFTDVQTLTVLADLPYVESVPKYVRELNEKGGIAGSVLGFLTGLSFMLDGTSDRVSSRFNYYHNSDEIRDKVRRVRERVSKHRK